MASSRKKKCGPGSVDQQAAHELKLYIDNDSGQHFGRVVPIRKNMVRKMARGEYDLDKAIKGWMYAVDGAAKDYHRVHGGAFGPAWHQAFDRCTRLAVAEDLAQETRDMAMHGELDEYIPKKYRGQPLKGTRGLAGRRVSCRTRKVNGKSVRTCSLTGTRKPRKTRRRRK